MPMTKEEKDALLTTDVVQQRLNAGLGITGGARGSLTKCATKLNVSHGLPVDNATKTELRMQQLEMKKLVIQVQRNDIELRRQLLEVSQQSEMDIDDSIETDGKSTAELHAELARLKEVQTCLFEYEALAKLTVAGKHAVSELVLRKELDEIAVQTKNVTEELQLASAACTIRQGQFHLLQQCLLDVKHSLQQPLELTESEMVAAQPPKKDDDDADKMEVDAKNLPLEDEKEEVEGDLYGDL